MTEAIATRRVELFCQYNYAKSSTAKRKNHAKESYFGEHCMRMQTSKDVYQRGVLENTRPLRMYGGRSNLHEANFQKSHCYVV